MSNLNLFLKIRQDIRSTLLGFFLFFVATASGVSWFLVNERNRQVEVLIVKQVDSLAVSRILGQDVLAIQQELSRFVESLKASFTDNIEVNVRLSGRLVAGDGNIKESILSTRIEKERTLPSGEPLSVTVKADYEELVLDAILILTLITASGFFTYRFLISKLEKSFDLESKPIKEKLDRAVILEHKTEIAEQVAHDIRSPLTSLDLAVRESSLNLNDKETLKKSIDRINDVLNDLTTKDESKNVAAQESKQLKDESLLEIINDILQEKSPLMHERPSIILNLEAISSDLIATVNRKELSRALSNVIDNAFDAIQDKGIITVTLKEDNDFVLISISDSGEGIAKEHLDQIGNRGATFGKSGGKGLGLFHAKTSLEAINGQLEIESTKNVGTTVIFKIPVSIKSKDILKEIKLQPSQKLIIIDDDPLIHQVWNLKVKKLGIELVSFYFPEDFESQVNRDLLDNSFFVIDYEFKGKEKTGAKLIAEYELQDRSVLISGRATQKEIILECEFYGIKRFPKESLHELKISFINTRTDEPEWVRVRRS